MKETPADRPAASAPVAEFHYRIAGRVASARPGSHPGRFDGDGALLRAHVPFGQGADPRRIDLRASARDPFGTLLVRRYRQPASLLVVTLVDVSASMRQRSGTGSAAPLSAAARFVASAGYSAFRSGDRFACHAAADRPWDAIEQRHAQGKAAGSRAADMLAALADGGDFGGAASPGTGAAGMATLAERLPSRQALVFLLSDFYWDDTLLETVLGSLSAHRLVPVVLHAGADIDALPASGLWRVADVESDAERTLWLRPALRARLEQAAHARRAHLRQQFRAARLRGLWLDAGFSADDVSRYFVG